MTRPYVLLSVAASVDGYIDDATDQRLLLSNDADFDRVDSVRAGVDAILVGSTTIRKDNPRLLVRSEQRRQQRLDKGLSETPVKVTITRSGDLDPQAAFFSSGNTEKLVYADSACHRRTSELLEDIATVVDAGSPVDLPKVLSDLQERGIDRLMVEGGGTIHTQFLTAGLVDQLDLVIAPFFVGNPAAPRFTNAGAFPQAPGNRMKLGDVEQIGDVVLLRYFPQAL